MPVPPCRSVAPNLQTSPVATVESEQKGTHHYDFEKAAHWVRRGGERLDRGCYSEFQRSESRIRIVGVTQEALLFVVVFAQPRPRSLPRDLRFVPVG
jgi:hypothetical protein